MLYEIQDNYYVKVGGNYISVDVNVDEKGDINIKPNNEKTIEASVHVLKKEHKVNDEFIKKIKEKHNDSNEEINQEKHKKSRMYNTFR